MRMMKNTMHKAVSIPECFECISSSWSDDNYVMTFERMSSELILAALFYFTDQKCDLAKPTILPG